MTVWFASGNIHKKKELSSILHRQFAAQFDARKAPCLEIKIPSEAGIEFAPEETGSTFFENALLKAEALYRLLEEKRPALYKSGDPVIADDSGICVDALGGRPGIHSARYRGKDGFAAGKKLTDDERNTLLLAEIAENSPSERSARFVCAMVLYYSPDRFYAANETLEGEIVKSAEEIRGKGGFGYDPLLYIPHLGRTVAELSDEEKNFLSHRGRAGKAIGQILCRL